MLFRSAFAVGVMQDVVGAAGVNAKVEPTMGSEDFAFMLQHMPGCYVFIGNGGGEHREMGHGLGPCNLHNPSYDFNDELLPIGATYWVRLAEAALPQASAQAAINTSSKAAAKAEALAA